MHYIHAVQRDELGQIDIGIHMWWTPGQQLYLYQTYEYRAAGSEYSRVVPDPIYKQDLGITLEECWSDYELVFYTHEYSG
jgi:hypothetical protein